MRAEQLRPKTHGGQGLFLTAMGSDVQQLAIPIWGPPEGGSSPRGEPCSWPELLLGGWNWRSTVWCGRRATSLWHSLPTHNARSILQSSATNGRCQAWTTVVSCRSNGGSTSGAQSQAANPLRRSLVSTFLFVTRHFSAAQFARLLQPGLTASRMWSN